MTKAPVRAALASLMILALGCRDRKLSELNERLERLEASARVPSPAAESTAEPSRKALEERIRRLEEEAKKNAEQDSAAQSDGEAKYLKGKKVTIRLNETGAEACAAQHLDCIGVESTEARDGNGKLGGYFIPDCFTRVLKLQCLIAGGKSSQYTYTPGKFARMTSAEDAASKKKLSTLISPVSNSLCLAEPEYDHAICVGF